MLTRPARLVALPLYAVCAGRSASLLVPPLRPLPVLPFDDRGHLP